MAGFDMKEYAKRGAELRARELEAELATIYKTFPELRSRRAAEGMGGRITAFGPARESKRRKRKVMSAAQRKAVSLRMKKYWAERRKAR